jgi:hypothetical protein
MAGRRSIISRSSSSGELGAWWKVLAAVSISQIDEVQQLPTRTGTVLLRN